MASVQDLKRRIRSIRNTRKITKAMELVASARLRRAQARIEAMRPYADRMMELMVGTARASSSVRGLPLLQRREEERSVAILPLTGDRGLAGAFNAQVPMFAQWDDHEVRDDWGPGELERASVRRDLLLLAARGCRAFHEFMPMRETPAEPGRVYRKIPYGPLLDVLLLDMRSYRGPNGRVAPGACGPR